MGWSTETTETISTITTTEKFGTAYLLNPGELSHGHIRGDNNNGSPSDDLIITIYGTLKESPGADDWHVLQTLVLDDEGDATGTVKYVGYQVSGVYKIRIGAISADTDEWDITEHGYRKDGINAS